MASWLRKILPLLIVHLCFGAVPQRWESIRTVELDGSESDEDIPHFEVLSQHGQSTPLLPFVTKQNAIPESDAEQIKARTNDNVCCASFSSQINALSTRISANGANDGTLASQISKLSTSFTNILASVTSQSISLQTLSSSYAVQSSQILDVKASAAWNIAVDFTQSSQISGLSSSWSIASTSASSQAIQISTLNTKVVSQSAQIASLSACCSSNNAGCCAVQSAQISSLSQTLAAVGTTVSSQGIKITSLVNSDMSQSSQILAISASAVSNIAVDGTQSSQISVLSNSLGIVSSSVSYQASQITALKTNDASQSAQITGLISSLESANNAITVLTAKVASLSSHVSSCCNQPTQIPGFEPQNCTQLKQIGQKLNGFYMVKKGGAPFNRVQTVFCDFSTIGSVGQTTIGFNDIKTDSMYFYATRNKKFVGLNAVIPYDLAPVNIGGGLNIATGIFTAFLRGRYMFIFNAAAGDGMNFVLLLNGVPQASAKIGLLTWQQSGLQVILNLVPGDRVGVSTWLGGIVYDSDGKIDKPFYTQFTGQLLEQDLIFS